MWKITINRDKCTDCGECLASCPGEVYERIGGKIEVAHPDECHGCHTCEAVCPEEACAVEEQ
jgi:NAD-dependent dihydropyrimidine dehydrogenase PreA subunit